MKQTNIFQKTIHNGIITAAAAVTVFFVNHPVYAQAKTLDKAKTALDTLKTELGKIIPVAAAVILLCLAIGYAGRYIEKDTFVRWAVGVVIAGSAAELVNMFFANA
ncbi:VirB2 family type IV secretion system major pilin TrwL [Bartonella florencae]|uniref:VirB2 family type IV secretion system major pilin TrwL n=1 Tax=Bartonella florencae TaxID=928210 RepID=UPI0002FB2625|nr:VirB2 family type IV secretion system major pilin TrwL [Bartonella florencae]